MSLSPSLPLGLVVLTNNRFKLVNEVATFYLSLPAAFNHVISQQKHLQDGDPARISADHRTLHQKPGQEFP